MIRLILVRHGQTDWNVKRRYQGHTDTLLNTTGQIQAHAVANRIENAEIDAIYSSDLQRAWATAAIIGQNIGLNPIAEPRLREMNFGIIEGMTFDEAQAKYPEMIAKWLEDRDQPPANGETSSAFSERVYAVIDDLRQKHDGETVLLVSHGGVLLEITRMLLRMPPAARWYFKIETASITEFTLYDETPILKKLNDTCHLDKD
jgi:alpha-ribazole phosphatase